VPRILAFLRREHVLVGSILVLDGPFVWTDQARESQGEYNRRMDREGCEKRALKSLGGQGGGCGLRRPKRRGPGGEIGLPCFVFDDVRLRLEMRIVVSISDVRCG
jgi:hypothetical protein